MKTKLNVTLITLTILILSANTASAASLRCKGQLVKTGDTSTEVKIKCGQPFDIEYTGSVKVKNKFVKAYRYTYVLGSGKLIKILEFEGGSLVRIINGPRT